jgi:hypothetical protein
METYSTGSRTRNNMDNHSEQVLDKSNGEYKCKGWEIWNMAYALCYVACVIVVSTFALLIYLTKGSIYKWHLTPNQIREIGSVLLSINISLFGLIMRALVNAYINKSLVKGVAPYVMKVEQNAFQTLRCISGNMCNPQLILISCMLLINVTLGTVLHAILAGTVHSINQEYLIDPAGLARYSVTTDLVDLENTIANINTPDTLATTVATGISINNPINIVNTTEQAQNFTDTVSTTVHISMVYGVIDWDIGQNIDVIRHVTVPGIYASYACGSIYETPLSNQIPDYYTITYIDNATLEINVTYADDGDVIALQRYTEYTWIPGTTTRIPIVSICKYKFGLYKMDAAISKKSNGIYMLTASPIPHSNVEIGLAYSNLTSNMLLYWTNNGYSIAINMFQNGVTNSLLTLGGAHSAYSLGNLYAISNIITSSGTAAYIGNITGIKEATIVDNTKVIAIFAIVIVLCIIAGILNIYNILTCPMNIKQINAFTLLPHLNGGSLGLQGCCNSPDGKIYKNWEKNTTLRLVEVDNHITVVDCATGIAVNRHKMYA